MNNTEFGLQLEKRTKDFSIDLITYCMKLKGNQEIRSVKNQVTRSGSSIGANYREANRARSRADFINKIRISLGEASETVYWLEVLQGVDPNNKENITDLLKEAKEILAIFTSISHKLHLNRK